MKRTYMKILDIHCYQPAPTFQESQNIDLPTFVYPLFIFFSFESVSSMHTHPHTDTDAIHTLYLNFLLWGVDIKPFLCVEE